VTIKKNSSIENNSTFVTDICIVGSGMSGQAIFSKLRDKKIIMIESGDIYKNEDIQILNNLEHKGINFRKNFQTRIRQLGGSGNLWANQLMVLKASDLDNRDWVAKDFSWPFDYDELKLLYKDVIKNIFYDNFKNFDYLDSSQPSEYDHFLEKEFLNTKMFEFNNHFWPNKINRFNLKSEFTKKNINSKNLDFISSFTATEMKIDENTQNVEYIKIQSKNKICKIKAKIFVLACGAIENAKILLNNQHKNKILQNNNIGRYFMDHPRVSLGTLRAKKKLPLSILFGIKNKDYDFRKSLSLSKKIQIDKEIMNSYAFLDPKFNKEDEISFNKFLSETKKIIKLNGIPRINYFKLNYKKIFEQLYFNLPTQISNSKLNDILLNLFKRKKYNLSFDQMYVHYQAEQFPNPESKIYLSDKNDIFNQKTVIVDWKLNKIDYKTQDEFSKMLLNKYNYHDLLMFEENNDKEITDASHHSGTTRMSINKSDGVVDKNCKVHDINNLYISGNSVLRVASSINPGLTNMAMSTRLGKFLNNLI